MLDKKSAYAILGLDEAATDEQVEARYAILLKRSRNRHAEAAEAGEGPTMDDITKAYNFIVGSAIEEEARRKDPKNKTLGRIGYIWEYYRWHIIGTIAVVLVIFYTTNSIMDNRSEQKKINSADLKVTFFTDFEIQDTAPFKAKLLENLKDWKDVYTVSQFAPTDPKDEYGVAMLQKAVVTMAADKADVYIMDKANFAKFGAQDAFLRLGDIPSLASVPQEKRVSVKLEDGSDIWAGIDVTANPAVKALTTPSVEKIAVIRGNANKKDNAAKALEWMGSN